MHVWVCGVLYANAKGRDVSLHRGKGMYWRFPCSSAICRAHVRGEKTQLEATELGDAGADVEVEVRDVHVRRSRCGHFGQSVGRSLIYSTAGWTIAVTSDTHIVLLRQLTGIRSPLE